MMDYRLNGVRYVYCVHITCFICGIECKSLVHMCAWMFRTVFCIECESPCFTVVCSADDRVRDLFVPAGEISGTGKADVAKMSGPGGSSQAGCSTRACQVSFSTGIYKFLSTAYPRQTLMWWFSMWGHAVTCRTRFYIHMLVLVVNMLQNAVRSLVAMPATWHRFVECFGDHRDTMQPGGRQEKEDTLCNPCKIY